jgi:choice-of-anchor B domain-containing protein
VNRIHQILVCIVFFFFSIMKNNAQISPAVNIQFRSNLTFPGQTGANICGYAANGKEYALFGNQTGMAIVDVTDPTTPVFLKQVTALSSLWREVKVYKHYAYITTEAAGQGLQIVDLTKLNLPVPDVDVKSFVGPEGDLVNISKIHALHIDTAKGFLYAFGGIITVREGVNTVNVSGALVLDIKTDPWNPRYAGKYAAPYIHDGFVINDTLYGGHIYAGYFSIIDFRDKLNPIVLGTKVTPNNFTHNTWRSDDGKTLFTTDERASAYVAAYDVSDPTNIKLLDKIRSSEGAVPIVHNTHVLNDYLITSWYTEGVTIVDAHRPQNLVQVGQYDSYNGSNGNFEGVWGVYPYLPSGNLLVSHYTSGQGIFVLTPQYVRACYLEGLVTSQLTGLTLSGVTVKINSTDMDKKAVSNNVGNYYTGQVTSGTFSVTYSSTGYVSQTVNVTLVNGVVTMQNIALVPISVPVELVDIKVKRTSTGAQLMWATASEIGVTSFSIERSRKETPSDFIKIGEVKAIGSGSNYIFDDANLLSSTHYYRLKINAQTPDDAKRDYSKIVSIHIDDKTEAKVTPSVSSGLFAIENGKSVEVFNNLGQLVFSKSMNTRLENINLSFLPSGQYIVRIDVGQRLFSDKIVILR